jgi:hypothetical protein
MATSSIVPLNPFLGQSTSEKLAKGNHALWKAQILTVVRGARLEDFLMGAAKAPEQKIKEAGTEVPNPLYEQWKATDQQVLGFLLLNMSRETLLQVSICKMTAEVWSFLEATFLSIKKARSVNTRISLSNTRKGNITISEYVGKMRTLADDMATSGKPLDEEVVVSYILASLDEDYDSIVTTLVARADVVSVAEAYAQLLHYEQRHSLLHGEGNECHSANMASLLHYEQRHSLLHGEGNERHSSNMASRGHGSQRPEEAG